MTQARRPTTEDVEPLCDAVATGQSLNAACLERGIHAGHTYGFLRADDRHWANYMRARAIAGDCRGHQVAEIVDQVIAGDLEPDRARVAIDGLKWTAGRMAQKIWGDKVAHEHTGADGGPIQMDLSNLSDEQLDQLEQLLGAAAVKAPEAE
jgi:hypothetical protein